MKKKRSKRVRAENPAWSAADFKCAVSFEQLPPSLKTKLKALGKRGRPRLAAPKQIITFRFAPDVLAGIKALGRGYNVRVEQYLRDALEKDRL